MGGVVVSFELAALIAFLALAALLALDDLVIDALAFVRGLAPRAVTPAELRRWRARPQKNIAVVVANWHEAEVIERMLRGNLERLEYARVWFFVGVYPNDPDTVNAARAMERSDPRVVVIENHRPGPTTKGQMLNVIFRQVLAHEERLGVAFDLFLLHDSEDVLHPQSLLLINETAEHADFVQIPVFSFPRGLDQWTASTYIDEFAEIHTKDLLVRDSLSAAIPSAGVGTAISRAVVLKLLELQGGEVLHEGSLTEDYVLGMTVKTLGFRSRFVSRFIPRFDDEGRLLERNFIATREYFPSSWSRAVRQKGRWIHGIVLQSPALVPLAGNFIERFFRLRDRKGPLVSLIGLLGLILFAASALALALGEGAHETFWTTALRDPVVSVLFSFNLFAGLVRLAQRFRAVRLVQDTRTAWMSLPRLPIANVLNFAASWRAISQATRSKIAGTAPAWTKTTHELPADFGRVAQPAVIPLDRSVPPRARAALDLNDGGPS